MLKIGGRREEERGFGEETRRMISLIGVGKLMRIGQVMEEVKGCTKWIDDRSR